MIEAARSKRDLILIHSMSIRSRNAHTGYTVTVIPFSISAAQLPSSVAFHDLGSRIDGVCSHNARTYNSKLRYAILRSETRMPDQGRLPQRRPAFVSSLPGCGSSNITGSISRALIRLPGQLTSPPLAVVSPSSVSHIGFFGPEHRYITLVPPCSDTVWTHFWRVRGWNRLRDWLLDLHWSVRRRFGLSVWISMRPLATVVARAARKARVRHMIVESY